MALDICTLFHRRDWSNSENPSNGCWYSYSRMGIRTKNVVPRRTSLSNQMRP